MPRKEGPRDSAITTEKSQGGASTQRPTLLVVDDDPDILLGMRLDLERFYTVLTANSVASARKQLAAVAPDAVILDLGLPDGDGLELLEHLQETPGGEQIPVLVLSGRDEFELPLRSRSTGAREYLKKPAEPVLLRARIESMLEAAPGRAGRVLIVEDDPDVRAGLALQLQGAGYEVMEAADGLGALILASREHPDAMLLDLGLPAADGDVVLQRLQQRADTASIPVIVVSAREPIDNANRVVTQGARMFLQKPVEGDLLVRALETVL